MPRLGLLFNSVFEEPVFRVIDRFCLSRSPTKAVQTLATPKGNVGDMRIGTYFPKSQIAFFINASDYTAPGAQDTVCAKRRAGTSATYTTAIHWGTVGYNAVKYFSIYKPDLCVPEAAMHGTKESFCNYSSISMFQDFSGLCHGTPSGCSL